MIHKRMKRKEYIKDIASQRIDILFNLTKVVIKEDFELASKYVELIRRIAMKAQVRLPRSKKMWICKKCNTLLIPGFTARIRIRCNRMTHIVITCLNCGNIKRYPVQKSSPSG